MNATNYPEDGWTRLRAASQEAAAYKPDVPDENGYTPEQKVAACHDIFDTSRKDVKDLVRHYHRVFVPTAPGTVVTDDRFYPELRQAAFEWYTNHRIHGLVGVIADMQTRLPEQRLKPVADPADFVVTLRKPKVRLKVGQVFPDATPETKAKVDAIICDAKEAAEEERAEKKTFLNVWNATQADGLASKLTCP